MEHFYPLKTPTNNLRMVRPPKLHQKTYPIPSSQVTGWGFFKPGTLDTLKGEHPFIHMDKAQDAAWLYYITETTQKHV